MVLQLTTPHMGAKNNLGPPRDPYSPHVQAFQRELRQLGTYHGKIDGEYGPGTAQAVWDTKNYKFGYLRPDKVAGDLFYSYCIGKKKPNAAMKALAKRRSAKHVTMSYKIFQQMVSKLGETEHPANSNSSYASKWYGFVGAWCAMAVSWACYHAGSRYFSAGKYVAYVPTLLGDAIAGRNKFRLVLRILSSLKSGYIICFKWPGESNAIADHVGIIALEADLRKECPRQLEEAIRAFGPLGSFDTWTIEGNTSVGNNSNGGMQMIRKRNLRDGTVAGIFSVAA